MNPDRMRELVQELVYARGPSGQEEEVRDIVLRELKAVADRTWVDDAGNAVGLLRAAPGRKRRSSAPDRPAPPVIRVMAHMDEIALSVKRVEPDGTLRVRSVGGLRPWLIGMGPVDILGDGGILPGVLSMGPIHTSEETPAVWKSKKDGKDKSSDWDQVFVVTRLAADALAAAGVHAGTRVALARSRRALVDVGDCIAGYFLDDRVCLAVMLGAAGLLRAAKRRPANDVYLVGTCMEEVGGASAAWAAAKLPGTVALAVDVGPTAAEYGTRLTADPIIAYRDRKALYARSVSDRLMTLGRELGMNPQAATFESYGSDASLAKAVGIAPLAGLLCVPTEGTHGFEIVPKAGIEACARLLAAYLESPVPPASPAGRSSGKRGGKS
ncbi:MAG: peptidase M42 [Planctomycetota bacterium]